MTNETNGTSCHKTAGFPMKPVVVELDDGRTIDAAHHITTDDNRLLHLYIEVRDGGIDVTVPLTDGDATAWARSDAGREALGIGTDDQDHEHELVADGGQRTCTECDTLIENSENWCSNECEDEWWGDNLGKVVNQDEETETYNHETGRWI